MKVLIAGPRTIDNIDISEYIPKDATVIISGGAKGIDTLAEMYADANNLEKIIIKPNYKRYGKFAPLKRNEEMVDMADKIIIFWDGKSRGTHFTLKYALKSHKPVQVFSVQRISGLFSEITNLADNLV